MNIVTRFGNWIEKHWPEKMTAEEVRDIVNSKFIASAELLSRHDERLSKIEAELNIFKTQAVIKSRIVGESPSNMTPFASRLQPVQPANGQATLGGAK